MKEKRTEGQPRLRYSVILSIGVALYSVIALSVSIPVFVRNLKASDIKEHYKAYYKLLKEKPTALVSTVFYTINGPVSLEREIEVKNRENSFLVIEALLKGVTKEDIENGIITYIPHGTKLEGMTIVNGRAFVRLSKEFEKSSALSLAKNQIRESLLQSGNIIEVNFIVNGLFV